MGGDCLNTGCVPSKALITTAQARSSQIEARSEFGIKAPAAEFDFADVMERVQRVIETDRAARFGRALHRARRRVHPGRGEDHVALDGRGQAASGTRTLTTRAIVIAAGARPFVPPIPGIEQVELPDLRHGVGPAQAAARGWWCWAAGRSAASWRRPSRASARR